MTDDHPTTRITPQPEQHTVIVERAFDAPRALVFDMFTKPEHLLKWFGPSTWPLVSCEIDLRVGGLWQYCMRGPQGEDACGVATYREVTPPERLAYLDQFAFADGRVNPEMPPLLVLTEFIEVDAGRTHVRSTTRLASGTDYDTLVQMGMLEGVTETWEQLAAYLATRV
jgi:uncharacterized protein YndB with AHSA1/START domain